MKDHLWSSAPFLHMEPQKRNLATLVYYWHFFCYDKWESIGKCVIIFKEWERYLLYMKIIFFDIDGTLIGGGSHIMSQSTRRAIRKARENGHICVINTGRTRSLVGREITDQVEFDGYLLGCGTMAVYHGRELMHQTFSREQSLRIMEGIGRHGIDAILEGCENNYCERPENFHTETFRNYIKRIPETYYTKLEYAPGRFDKFFAYVDEKERMDAFQAEFGQELDFIDREHGFYEIVPKGCSKATAIQFLADRLRIPLEDTVAIGDSNNDLPMLKYAGTSIAMGNATRAVLDMADYVTTDVMNDGIWNALGWLGVLEEQISGKRAATGGEQDSEEEGKEGQQI